MLQRKFLFLCIFFIIITGCRNSYSPKPMGYPRVDFPEKNYVLYDAAGPYSFEYPAYARIEADQDPNSEPWWINIRFPSLNGTIHISYKAVQNNLETYIEDSRTLVYKHATKAENIEETPVIDPENKRYGILYDLSGNVASGVQFFLTDSTTHFLRGSLYFNSTPNKDSLYPVIRFVRDDIIHLIETTRWK